MIFACDRCGRRYSVPDERIQGRAFRVTCKSCGNVIVVRPGAASVARPAAAPPATGQPAPARPAAAPVTGQPAPARPAAASAARPAPPAIPKPAAPPAAQQQLADAPTIQVQRPERGLSAAEMAWMSSDETPRPQPRPEPGSGEASGPGASLQAPGAGVDDRQQWAAFGTAGGEATQTDTSPPDEPQPRAERKGPGVLRVALAAVILGLAAAAILLLVWPAWRAQRAPRPTAAANVPSGTPVPSPPPEQGAPAAPEPAAAADAAPPVPASAPAPEVAPPPPPPAPAEPRASSKARFEPGTVTVGKVTRKKGARLNRKDRRLLDLLARKQDGAAPPEPVEKLDLDTGRSLDPAAVERVMAESQGAFSGCVTRAAKGQAAVDPRRATLLLTVAGSGEVASAWVAESDISRTGLGRCLATAARRLVFPAFEGGPVDVSVPLVLEAR